MISLRNRLVLVYASFICAAVVCLGLIINRFAEKLFAGFVTENIRMVSSHIALSMADLYNPMADSFDVPTVESMGMYFVHEGYIITVEDTAGNVVWDARSCDMEQCAAVIQDIGERMKNRYGLSGSFQGAKYPMQYRGREIGSVII